MAKKQPEKELQTIQLEEVGEVADVLAQQVAEVVEVEELTPDPITLRTTVEEGPPRQFIASVKLRDPYTGKVLPKGNPVVVEVVTGWLRSQINAGLVREV